MKDTKSLVVLAITVALTAAPIFVAGAPLMTNGTCRSPGPPCIHYNNRLHARDVVDQGITIVDGGTEKEEYINVGEEPLQLDADFTVHVDPSDYMYSNEDALGGDVDPDMPVDEGEHEDEGGYGPEAAGVQGPVVKKIGKDYVWEFTDMSKNSIAPFGVKKDIWGGAKPNINRKWVKDPKNKKQTVLRVDYPKGTSTPSSKWNPKGVKGGTGIYAQPIPSDILAKAKFVVFEYEVYFPANFDFVKGGKLPGLYGTVGGNKFGCSGGNSALTCFSLRYMWRRKGDGEAYLYLPSNAKQDPGYCKIKPFTHCDPQYGDSVGRGSFTFKLGGWTKITQLIGLGPAGKRSGTLKIWANGKLVIQNTKLVWRTDPKVTVQGFAVETFFGGSTADFRTTKDEYTLFKNFKLTAKM